MRLYFGGKCFRWFNATGASLKLREFKFTENCELLCYPIYINKFQKKAKFSNQEISLRENLWNKWIQVRGALLQKPAEESSISFK